MLQPAELWILEVCHPDDSSFATRWLIFLNRTIHFSTGWFANLKPWSTRGVVNQYHFRVVLVVEEGWSKSSTIQTRTFLISSYNTQAPSFSFLVSSNRTSKTSLRRAQCRFVGGVMGSMMCRWTSRQIDYEDWLGDGVVFISRLRPCHRPLWQFAGFLAVGLLASAILWPACWLVGSSLFDFSCCYVYLLQFVLARLFLDVSCCVSCVSCLAFAAASPQPLKIAHCLKTLGSHQFDGLLHCCVLVAVCRFINCFCSNVCWLAGFWMLVLTAFVYFRKSVEHR